MLLDRVIDGQLDGAHMLAGQPLGATIGFGTKADIVTAFSMDLNGNGITVCNAVWQEMKPLLPTEGGRIQHPIKADALKKVVDKWKAQGKPFKMGMVFPVSTHNYELRYWLAAGGLHPGYYTASDISGTKNADVLLSVTPPPQMPATMEAGTINGYCVGEPWNQQAVFKGIGVPVITDYEIWKNNPEKVFGVTAGWADKNPNTHVAVVKALIRACMWLDASMANRIEAVKMLAKPNYVGADAEVIGNSMTGTFEYEKGDKRPLPDFNVFFRYFATYPFYSDAIWYLTQMRRWGQIAENKPDSWYIDDREEDLPAGRLHAGGEGADRRRQGEGSRLPDEERRLQGRAGRFHRRHRLRRPQAQRVPGQIQDRPEGQRRGLTDRQAQETAMRTSTEDVRPGRLCATRAS